MVCPRPGTIAVALGLETPPLGDLPFRSGRLRPESGRRFCAGKLGEGRADIDSTSPVHSRHTNNKTCACHPDRRMVLEPFARHTPPGHSDYPAAGSAVSIRAFRPAFQPGESVKVADSADCRRSRVDPERNSGVAGLENRPPVGGLCALDYSLRRGGGIMGGNHFINSGRIIHILSSISPPKRIIFPKVYPQNSRFFLQKPAVFPEFSTI